MTAFRASSLFAILALAGFISSLNAQLIIRSFEAEGTSTNVRARIHFYIDPTNNTVTVEVDNRWAGSGIDNKGTITSFGFNTPFSDSFLGTNGSNVSFTQNWQILKPGRTEPADWRLFEPYVPSQSNGYYRQDIGVGTGTTASGGTSNNGIYFGEQVQFKFQFANFSEQQAKDFFKDKTFDVTVRWQSIGECDYSDIGFGTEIPPTPEPSTYGMIGAGALLGLVAHRRYKKKQAAAAQS